MSGEPGMLRLATRRSALALAQSTAVGEQLAALTGRTLELVEVTTTGDVDRSSLAQIGGTGVFVAAVRTAVVDGHADVAVHSLWEPVMGAILAAALLAEPLGPLQIVGGGLVLLAAGILQVAGHRAAVRPTPAGGEAGTEAPTGASTA